MSDTSQYEEDRSHNNTGDSNNSGNNTDGEKYIKGIQDMRRLV